MSFVPKQRVRQKQIDQSYLFGNVRRIKPNGRVTVRWTHKAYAGGATVVAEPVPFTTSELPENIEGVE